MHGEQQTGAPPSCPFPGPSPRARGAVTGAGDATEGRGTIPACTGSRPIAAMTTITVRDHPRVHGEQLLRLGFGVPGAGPSPRARGAGGQSGRGCLRGGTIPACTGSSRSWRWTGSWPWDHLHGEQGANCDRNGLRGGPSPRARGAGPAAPPRVAADRTIPACTGSRRWRPGPGASKGDHPRVHGEQLPGHLAGAVPLGPSPRARGAVERQLVAPAHPGTIPACTGSSAGREGATPGLGDHPRVHGEQRMNQLQAQVAWGPSPRARGAAATVWTHVQTYGTIPACTGSRPRPTRSPLCRRDHPRVHGEQHNRFAVTGG